MPWSEDTIKSLSRCNACPRKCGANRANGQMGACGATLSVRVARAAPMFWEEPCISGKRGSGAVFFCGCPVKCVFCQNSEISNGENGVELDFDGLCGLLRRLISTGVHNLNFVTPTHYALQLRDVLETVKPDIPVVWNCGGYESAETLKKLSGLVDIYLADYKFDKTENGLCACKDYADVVEPAISEMFAQVGRANFDEDGMMTSGLILRHLVLPGRTGMSKRILERISALVPLDTPVSLMSQYFPAGKAKEIKGLNRRISEAEYKRATDYMLALGFTNGYFQDISSADSGFVPDFDLTGVLE
ncbi:MAG: radical SAM protein [Oscillospiraceae bacterium]|nr:radical SAM protein [Oscillospiraceae bacterium]